MVKMEKDIGAYLKSISRKTEKVTIKLQGEFNHTTIPLNILMIVNVGFCQQEKKVRKAQMRILRWM